MVKGYWDDLRGNKWREGRGVCDDEKEMFWGGDPNAPRKTEYLHYTPILDDNLRAYILASSNFFLNLSTNSIYVAQSSSCKH